MWHLCRLGCAYEVSTPSTLKTACLRTVCHECLCVCVCVSSGMGEEEGEWLGTFGNVHSSQTFMLEQVPFLTDIGDGCENLTSYSYM